MRAVVVALLITALAVVGCGDPEEGGDGGGVTASEPTADEGCSDTYPSRQETVPGYDGYVIVCFDAPAGVILDVSIENISDTAVIGVSPVGNSWKAHAFDEPPELSFAQSQVKVQVPARCDVQSCSLPPGSTLKIAGDLPVRASIDTLQVETLAAAVAYTGLQRVNSKLGRPGDRLLSLGTACYQSVAASGVTDRPYEEQFRNMLGLSSCYALYKEVAQTGADPPLERPGAVKTLYNRAQRLLGASFNDAMVFLLKILPR